MGNGRFFVASRCCTVILRGKKSVYMYVKVYPVYAVEKLLANAKTLFFRFCDGDMILEHLSLLHP